MNFENNEDVNDFIDDDNAVLRCVQLATEVAATSTFSVANFSPFFCSIAQVRKWCWAKLFFNDNYIDADLVAANEG